MDAKEKRIIEFTETKKLCETDAELINAIEQSKNMQKIYWEGEEILPGEARFSAPAKLVVSKKKTVEAAGGYEGKKVCILNFASSVSPGGGVVNGAQAQEESICRVSTLYFSIADKATAGAFYDRHWDLIHKKEMNRRNTDDIIYTPGIIAVRDDSNNEQLLPKEKWYGMDVITCAAPDIRITGDDTQYTPDEQTLYNEFVKRWKCILATAAKHEADVLILGAFGCGVFANPPKLVASAFCDAFSGFKNYFDTIEFAVFSGRDESNYLEFKECIENLGV